MTRMNIDAFDYVAFRHGFGDQFAPLCVPIYEDILETMGDFGHYPHLFIKGKTIKANSDTYISRVEEPIREIMGDAAVDQYDITALCVTQECDVSIPVKIGWSLVHRVIDALNKQSVCAFLDRFNITTVELFTKNDRNVLLITFDTDSV